MYTLDLSVMLPKMRQAYVDKRLAFQRGIDRGAYRYSEDPKACCIVGAALDDETAHIFDQHGVLSDVVRALGEDGVQFLGEGCYDTLCELQHLHDRAVSYCVSTDAHTKTKTDVFTSFFNKILIENGLEAVANG